MSNEGIGFEAAQELFYGSYYLDHIQDNPEQWVAIGWVDALLYSVIFEEREDGDGLYYHLVTLWKSTPTERKNDARASARRRAPRKCGFYP